MVRTLDVKRSMGASLAQIGTRPGVPDPVSPAGAGRLVGRHVPRRVERVVEPVQDRGGGVVEPPQRSRAAASTCLVTGFAM
jgi:hypothetical protein